eukprot:COSAG02_NODE_1857_length_10645_cov_24.485302_11_plen_226_part_00
MDDTVALVAGSPMAMDRSVVTGPEALCEALHGMRHYVVWWHKYGSFSLHRDYDGQLFEHSQYGKDVHVDKQDLIAGIDVSTAEGWDTGPRCRQWRQQRYDHAVAQGLTQREAIANTLCCNFSGFIDDGQLSTIACMMPLVMAALFRVVAKVGVTLSVAKLQWAQDNQLWTVTPPEGQEAQAQQPTHPDELTWSQSHTDRFAVCLGRQIDTVHSVGRDQCGWLAEY